MTLMETLSLIEAVIIALLIFIILTQKEEKDMIELYVALIIAGRRPFSRVPDRYKEAVREMLLSLGLDEDGNPIED